jgi:2-polyprenyl-3-methyl-5-hydroxy-6-metoxy-1,4-benzoquinol methylase
MPLESLACAICDNSHTTPFLIKFDLAISRCPRCGLIFSNPRLSREEIWRRYSPDYFWKEYLPALGVTNGAFDLEYFDRRHAAVLSLIARHRPPPGRLFEVGAGAGFFLKSAERAGWTVSGIEVSPEGARFAAERLALAVRQQSAEEIEEPPASLDAVVMFDVIEHLLDPLRTLRAVRAALVDRGVLAISTPNINALSRWGLGRNWAVLSPSEHLYYFSEDTLRKILERAGFARTQFIRQHAGQGVYETMNPRYTHAPTSPRTKTYEAFVSTLGPMVYRTVQALGKGDTLTCIATPA